MPTGLVIARELHRLTAAATMRCSRRREAVELCAGAILFFLAFTAPGFADGKQSMGSYGQDRQTCLPYSGANLLWSFSEHGFNNLRAPGLSPDAAFDKMVRDLIGRAGSSYDVGTRVEPFAAAMESYIKTAGYFPKISMRGLRVKDPLDLAWFDGNASYRRGYILLISAYKFDPAKQMYLYANRAHAVTLMSIHGRQMTVADPAHLFGSNGEKSLRLVPAFAKFEGTLRNDPHEQFAIDGNVYLGKEADLLAMLDGAIAIEIYQNEAEWRAINPVPEPKKAITAGP